MTHTQKQEATKIKTYDLLGYYSASKNPLPTFPDNVSVPYSGVRKSNKPLPTFRDRVSVPYSRVKKPNNPLPTFRDNVSVPSSRVKKFKSLGFLDP
jgi:sporulation protein YlmC with PRC-barrel domain